MNILAITAEFDWTAIATNLGFGGFVMWFAWHTQTHVIPALLLQHRDEREQSRKDFLAAITEARKDFLASEDVQRRDYLMSRADARVDMQTLINCVTKLAEITHAHIGEARAVWSARGERDHESKK